MLRLIGIATLPLFLASCGADADGYDFTGAEYEKRMQDVAVVEHVTMRDLRRAAPAAAHVEGRELMGFSYLRSDGCEIHVGDLRKSAARAWLGHEMTHCVYGRWHK